MDDLKNLPRVRPDWAKVMAEMVKFDLNVERWRASVRTDWANLGLDKAAFEKAYTPGTRRLLPPNVEKELEHLERMARALVEKPSYKTLFGYLMPKETYWEVKRLLTEAPLTEVRRYVYHSEPPAFVEAAIWDGTPLMERWRQLAEEIASNRDRIVDEVAELYTDSLIEVYRATFAKPDATPEIDAEMGAWLDEQKSKLVEVIPSAATIRRSFAITWTLSEVDAPPEAIKAAKLEDLQRRERELNRQIAAAKSEEERLKLEREREGIERDRRIAAEVANTRQYAEAQFQRAIDQIIGQVQGEIYDLVIDSLEYIEQNNALHPRNVGRLNNLIALVTDKLAGLTNDQELRRVCTELETLSKSGVLTKEEQKTQVMARLRDIGISMRADLVLAGVTSRGGKSGRAFGIPDEPTFDLVRKARRLDQEPNVLFEPEATPVRGSRPVVEIA